MYAAFFASIAALLSGPAAPSGAWDGVYEHTHNGGRTAGGSPIVVTWRLTLRNGACRFHGEGYQTLETLDCLASSTPDGLEVRFRRYPPPASADRFGVQVYKPGASLFVLSKSKSGLLTKWTGFVPDEGVERSPSPFFRKVR